MSNLRFLSAFGIIHIIPKGQKDQRHSSNWCPLTLLNTLYKLITSIQGRQRKTMEDYHSREKEKQAKAIARGRAEFSTRKSSKPKDTTVPSTLASSSSRSSSVSSSGSKSSLVSHLPLPLPVCTSAPLTPPNPGRTTPNDAYQGPPVGSKEYKKLKPLMLIPPPHLLSRVSQVSSQGWVGSPMFPSSRGWVGSLYTTVSLHKSTPLRKAHRPQHHHLHLHLPLHPRPLLLTGWVP